MSHAISVGEIESAMRIAKYTYSIANTSERILLGCALGRYIPHSGIDFKKK
ncbi:hypothetical protein ACFYYS_16990 [Streptomyces sp. NPDC002120]|uniref:hypothetical protein n=1 Tax=Streptomyces sp. NPDC002120 TaxID=3364631 RepID=UPI0036BE6333